MARASMTKTSIDYWVVDLGEVCVYDSIENPKKFVDAINAAIDEEIAAALSGKLVLEKHSCKDDAARPEENETVIISYQSKRIIAQYFINFELDEFFAFNNSVIQFTDADYWCRLEGVTNGKSNN